MKITFKTKTKLAILLCAGLLAMQPVFANSSNEDPIKKSKDKEKGKAFASLNNQSVKIYPDAWRKVIHVVAKDNDKKEIDFFVFDLQGTLVHNYKLKSRDHFKVAGLAKGTYIYRVFTGDVEAVAGKFVIR